MPDAQEIPAEVPTQPDLCTELGASLSSVWARFAGARPSSAEVDFDGRVVHWILQGGTGEFERGMAAAEERREPGDRVLTMADYERETSAAVARGTHRRVAARISKHNRKTDEVRETFILEAPTRKY